MVDLISLGAQLPCRTLATNLPFADPIPELRQVVFVQVSSMKDCRWSSGRSSAALSVSRCRSVRGQDGFCLKRLGLGGDEVPLQ
jgi:hypothetical protein